MDHTDKTMKEQDAMFADDYNDEEKECWHEGRRWAATRIKDDLLQSIIKKDPKTREELLEIINESFHWLTI